MIADPTPTARQQQRSTRGGKAGVPAALRTIVGQRIARILPALLAGTVCGVIGLAFWSTGSDHASAASSLLEHVALLRGGVLGLHRAPRKRGFVCITGQLPRLELATKLAHLINPLADHPDVDGVDVALVLSPDPSASFTNSENGDWPDNTTRPLYYSWAAALGAAHRFAVSGVTVREFPAPQPQYPLVYHQQQMDKECSRVNRNRRPTKSTNKGSRLWRRGLRIDNSTTAQPKTTVSNTKAPSMYTAKFCARRALNHARQYMTSASCLDAMVAFGGRDETNARLVQYDFVGRVREDAIIPSVPNVTRIVLVSEAADKPLLVPRCQSYDGINDKMAFASGRDAPSFFTTPMKVYYGEHPSWIGLPKTSPDRSRNTSVIPASVNASLNATEQHSSSVAPPSRAPTRRPLRLPGNPEMFVAYAYRRSGFAINFDRSMRTLKRVHTLDHGHGRYEYRQKHDSGLEPHERHDFIERCLSKGGFRVDVSVQEPNLLTEGCRDDPTYRDRQGRTCKDYVGQRWCGESLEEGEGWNRPESLWLASMDKHGVSAQLACCGCGGGLPVQLPTTARLYYRNLNSTAGLPFSHQVRNRRKRETRLRK